MVVPETFVLPPWYLFVPLAVALVGVVAVLWLLEPPVTDETIVSFVPWMMLGSALHVLYKIDAFPPLVETLFSAPAVYATTATVAGAVWILGSVLYAAGLQRSIEWFVGVSGTGFFAVFASFAVLLGWDLGTFQPFWPVISVIVAGVVTAVAWIALSLWFTQVATATGATGVLVVFSQVLDGVSTAIGYDVLGAGEEVPLSQVILETGATLPTAEYLGAGWLFVLVKLLLSVAIVGLFAEFVREAPRRGRLALGLVVAVGLGPGTHNVLLFVVT